ncbi:MAG: hypothetical protein WDW38_009576 [Sanguina aurantia]
MLQKQEAHQEQQRLAGVAGVQHKQARAQQGEIKAINALRLSSLPAEQVTAHVTPAAAAAAAAAAAQTHAQQQAGTPPDASAPQGSNNASSRPRTSTHTLSAARHQRWDRGASGGGSGGGGSSSAPRMSSPSLPERGGETSRGSPVRRPGSCTPPGVARAAGLRQAELLQQPLGELDGPVLAAAAAARAALEEERAVRSAQDADLQQSLATDAAGALAAEQQPEVLAQAQAHEQTVAEAAAAAQHISGALAAATRDAVTTLPAEPSEDEGSAVSIRARLPDGSSHVRRFGAASPVADVHQWVRGLEGMPPWDPSSWRLVSSFPRAVLDPGVTVGDCALGGRQVMVFVERAGAADADA